MNDTISTISKQNTELFFTPFIIDVEEEPQETKRKLNKNEEKLLKQYEVDQSESEIWGKEKYENLDTDKIFTKFHKRIQRSPEQCIRYCFGGKPLWISSVIPTSIPNCQNCNAPRIFELELLPTLISLGLKFHNKKSSSKEKIEFGTVTVFSCSKSCTTSTNYVQEYIFVQPTI